MHASLAVPCGPWCNGRVVREPPPPPFCMLPTPTPTPSLSLSCPSLLQRVFSRLLCAIVYVPPSRRNPSRSSNVLYLRSTRHARGGGRVPLDLLLKSYGL